jgi:CRP-like cAMP-binding protein
MQMQPAINKASSTVSFEPPMLFGCVELTGAVIALRRSEKIFAQGEPADYIYKVMQGVVKQYTLLSDGRRQISGFYLPGEVFGLESGAEHGSFAEAIADSSILMVRRSTLVRSAEHDSEIARNLWSLTARELRRSQNHALLMIKSARERLAAFLLEMADRMTGKDNGTVDLPMSRQDIADYLGLTIETVSRIITQLTEENVIEVLTSRRIILSDRPTLNALNS